MMGLSRQRKGLVKFSKGFRIVLMSDASLQSQFCTQYNEVSILHIVVSFFDWRQKTYTCCSITDCVFGLILHFTP